MGRVPYRVIQNEEQLQQARDRVQRHLEQTQNERDHDEVWPRRVVAQIVSKPRALGVRVVLDSSSHLLGSI